MKNIFLVIFIFCFIIFCLPVLAQETTAEAITEIKQTNNFTLFWQEVKETFRILFSWGNVEKATTVLDIADQKLEDYKKYRASQEDKLASRSLARYQKEIDIVLDVLEKESDPQKAEQIAEEVSQRTIKSLVELEELYEEAPPSFKEKISQIISKLSESYKISQSIMSGEYQEVFQSKWGQFKARLEEGLKKIYYKLWPI